MEFIALKEGLNPEFYPKLEKKIDYFNRLIQQLKEREIPETTIEFINNQIKETNSQELDSKKLLYFMRRVQVKIFQHLEKELKLVRKGHYKTMWLALGMAIFGVPLGVAFGFAMNNLGLLGVGIPIGMAIGIALGAGMDAKALSSGNQLDLAIEN